MPLTSLFFYFLVTDNDLQRVQKDLEDAGAPMPAFQRIGGLLSGSRDGDKKPFRKAIEAVDKAIALQVNFTTFTLIFV